MSETHKKQQHKEHQVAARSRIDSNAQLIDPIDYSFKDILNFEEIKELQPRFAGKNSEPKKKDGKYISNSLKLGYNALTEINGLYEWCSFCFLNPNEISSLDLSFNCFSNVPAEITKFQGLKCLYLHGNKINDMAELEKLSKLTNLTTFAVHGNPIENLAGFRFYIIAKLPNLRHLNFCGVSKAETETAKIWMRSNRHPLKLETVKHVKRKTKSEED